jgi:protein-L-isoaspartate(D-aspartate) O-methyltransferase
MQDISFPSDGMSYIKSSFITRLRSRGIGSSRVLDVMEKVPRNRFVSEALQFRAYDETSLPIGQGQTLSSPLVIATMLQAGGLTGQERVLEVGTGSGYQTALLALLAREVVSMERIGELYSRSRSLLNSFGFSNIIQYHSEDFSQIPGTFDIIIVAAGAAEIPRELFGKVNNHGRLLIPVHNGSHHEIRKFTLLEENIVEETIGNATFVPLIQGGVPL